MFFYRNVEPETLSAELRAAANATAAIAAAELALPIPTIQWFVPCNEQDASWKAERPEVGHAQSNQRTIWICAEQTAQQVRDTVSHEVRHLWQFANGHLEKYTFRSTATGSKRAEHDAEQYCRAAAQRTVALAYTPAFQPRDEERLKALQDEARALLKELA